jgi:hypothetical protein
MTLDLLYLLSLDKSKEAKSNNRLGIRADSVPKETTPGTFPERDFSMTFAWISKNVLLYAHLVKLNIVYSLKMIFMLSARYYTRDRELGARQTQLR